MIILHFPSAWRIRRYIDVCGKYSRKDTNDFDSHYVSIELREMNLAQAWVAMMMSLFFLYVRESLSPIE